MNIWPPLTRRGWFSDEPASVLGSFRTPCSTLTRAPKPKEGWIKGVVFDGFGGVHNTPLVIFDYIQPLTPSLFFPFSQLACEKRKKAKLEILVWIPAYAGMTNKKYEKKCAALGFGYHTGL